MYLIPEVKNLKQGEKKIINGCTFSFPENIDKRVIKLCQKLPRGKAEVVFDLQKGDGEEYKIEFSDKIKITASSSFGISSGR